MNLNSPIGLLSALAFFNSASALYAPGCPEASTQTLIEVCLCEGQPCSLSLTITSTPAAFFCGNCRWSYSYTVNCPGNCSASPGSGSVNLNCNPHTRGAQAVIIPCPAGGDWVRVDFTCGWCQ
ncbi:MAG: hypothetical protein NTY35_09800 [Planctomycetota bacterium]|nr:hypothetical protein [Planctomycetota bacterium]